MSIFIIYIVLGIGTIAVLGYLMFLILVKKLLSKSIVWEIIMSLTISFEILCLIYPGLYQINKTMVFGIIIGTIFLFLLGRVLATLIRNIFKINIKLFCLIELCCVLFLWAPTTSANIKIEEAKLKSIEPNDLTYNHRIEEIDELKKSIPISIGLGVAVGIIFLGVNIYNNKKT